MQLLGLDQLEVQHLAEPHQAMVPLLLLLLLHPSRRQAKWCLPVGIAWLPSRQQPKKRRCVITILPMESAKAVHEDTASLRLCMLLGCGKTQHARAALLWQTLPSTLLAIGNKTYLWLIEQWPRSNS